MKKIFFAMTVLAGVVFDSCTNDDIEVTSAGKRFNASCTINTQGLYDTFDLTQKIRDNYLRKKTMGVGVITYLYNSEGKLINDPKIECNYNFNPVVVNFENILEGDYTVVCVETLVNPDDDYENPYEIVDAQSLSLVALKHDINTFLYDVNCVAVGTQTFHVEEGDQSISVVPEALGSRILCFYYNFTGSDFTEVGVGTEGGLDRYFFDPSLAEDDHFYYDYNEEGKFHVINSLNVDMTDDYHGIAYVLDKDWEWFNCYRTEAHEPGMWSYFLLNNAPNKVQLERGKEYYIGFYYLDKISKAASKLCTSSEELQQFVQDCQEVNVGNTPVNVEFHAPYCDWDNGTVSNVMEYMKDYVLEDGLSNDYKLTYKNEDETEMFVYSFANEVNGLFMSAYYTTLLTVSDACSVLEKSGYSMLSKDDNMYITADFRTVAKVSEEDGVVCVIYMDMKSVESNQRTPQSIVKQIRKAKKPAMHPVIQFYKNIEKPLLRVESPKTKQSYKLMNISK